MQLDVEKSFMINFDDSFARQSVPYEKIIIASLKIIERYGFRADMAMVWPQ
jgi:hypothetical protein